MDYLIDLKKQNLSGKVALEGGISLGVDTDGNIKKIDESGAISDIGGSVDESRLLPENPANGDIPCFNATATIGGGNDANTKILLHFDADEIKDEAAGNAAPVTITKKTGTITVVEGGKWGKCAKYVTGSMTVATNLDELNANNWVVSGWFNPDENNHGVSYPTWLSMDDQNTHGFGFDSTGRYGESDGPLFYLDTPPASGTWHWLAIVKYSGGLRFYLNGAFLNEISAQQRANFCSTLAIGGFAGTYAAGSTERTFSGLVDEVRLQYIPDDEITQWTGTSIAVPDAPYSKPQTVGEWGKFNKSELAMKSDLSSGNIVTNISGATADSTGYVNLNDTGTYDLFAVKNNTVPWAAPPSVLMPIGSRRVQRFYSENTAALSLSDNSLFPFVPEELGDGRFVTLKPTDASQPMWFGICTDGFKMEISNFTVRLHGDTDCSFEYELYGSAYEESDYSPLNGRWNLVHSGEIYLINNGDFKTATEDIPIASRGYYRSYAFVMKNVSGPGIISWNPSYIGNSWGRLTPVLSVNGHYVSANTNEITLPAATASAAGLMAAEDKAVIAGLTARGIYPELYNVVDPIDFNQLTTQGFYFIGGGADHINYPGTNAKLPGTLTVLRRGNYLTQTFSAVGAIGTSVWERNMYRANIGDAFTITDWHRLISDADITESKARPGYFKLPGGTIVQWGAASNITADGSTQITFPVAFPNAFLIGNATAVSGNASASGVVVSLAAVLSTGMTLLTKNHPGNGNDINVHWLAIGY